MKWFIALLFSCSLALALPSSTKTIWPNDQDANNKKIINLDKSGSGLQPAFSTANTIWVTPTGNNSTGARGQEDKPFLTVAAATAATGITSGDVIKVGAGTFNETQSVILPDGVSLVGSGQGVSIISSNVPVVTGACVVVGSNATIADLTIRGTLDAGSSYQRPLGSKTNATGIVLYNLNVSGDSDGLQMGSSAAGVFMRAYACTFTGKLDACQVTRGVAEFYNCAAVATGPSNGGTYTGGVTAVGNNVSNFATVYWFGGSVAADGASATNSAFETRGTGTTAVIEANNVHIYHGVSASNNYDLNNGISATINYNNIVRDDGLHLVTNGTVTPLGYAISPVWTGQHTYSFPSIGGTPDDSKGIILTNPTSTTSFITSQISPMIKFIANARISASNHEIDWRIYDNGGLQFEVQDNSGGYSSVLNLARLGNTSQINTALLMGQTDSSTSGVLYAIQAYHASSGTPVAGFGTGIEMFAQDSAVVNNLIGLVHFIWTTATHGSNVSDYVVLLNNSNSVPSEVWRIKGSGGAIKPVGSTFANLPTASAGITQAYITDGLAANCGDTSCTTFGTTVTGGGGSLKLLLWYNGSNWTLIGK